MDTQQTRENNLSYGTLAAVYRLHLNICNNKRMRELLFLPDLCFEDIWVA